MKSLHKQKGFSAIDLTVGALFISALLIIAAPYFGQMISYFSGGKIDIQVAALSSGAKCYRDMNRTYAGMDNDELLAVDCVTDEGLYTNDFGGANSVAPLSSNPATGYVITIAGISNDGLGERKAREYVTKGDNASYSGGTLSIEKTL